MTNKWNTTLYTGVSGCLINRVFQYKTKLIKGFTEKYNINKLVYIEEFDNPYDAICREKQIKGWLRAKKLQLIKSVNPTFKDLSEDWYDKELFSNCHPERSEGSH